ncbi:MAG: hypothetical protein R3F30_13610 [Planctomycetota bacterium]
MDVGDRTTHYCLLRDREVVGGDFPTTGKGLDRALQAHAGSG